MRIKKNKGITLIALVITIIVLLILAAISIQALKGRDGILNQAEKAVINDSHGRVAEALKIDESEFLIDKNTNKTTNGLIEYLQEKGVIDKNLVINVEEIFGSSIETGRGSGLTDVYVLEKSTQTSKAGKLYDIVYYDEDGIDEKIGVVTDFKEVYKKVERKY